jgi:AcrR family transcriptional regulator
MTRAEIVAAAFKAWGRCFYQNTSLSQVARELGVSKPALYRYFLRKQALTAAMTERFFDDFAACIRADYERALQSRDREAGVFIMLRSIAEYYARNVYAFVFSLINVYDRDSGGRATAEYLRDRGVDMGAFHRIVKDVYAANPLIMQLMFAGLTFFMADFHKIGCTFSNPVPEETARKTIDGICEIIRRGLGYDRERAGLLNFEELENRVAAAAQNVEEDPLLRAVAGAVAEAGPWGASMDMVARRSGLSKSSLYGHFKSKRDMLARLFVTEFARILAFARRGMSLSALPAEQLYLGIFSIAVYLRSRPEILTALDWIRTRRLDLGGREQHEKEPNFFHLFEDIDIGALPGGENEEGKRQVSHWVLFLLVNILMNRAGGQVLGNVQNSDIRTLYRFLTLGLEGFKKC